MNRWLKAGSVTSAFRSFTVLPSPIPADTAPDHRPRKLCLPWRLVVNLTRSYRSALTRSMSIGRLPELLATDLVRKSGLARIDHEASFSEVGLFAVYQDRAFQPRRMGRFVDHLAQFKKPSGP